MKLLTNENLRTLPPLYAQDGKGQEAMVYLKFFDPCGSWTWYATEGSLVCDEHGAYDCVECPKAEWSNFIFFGMVDGHEKEMGYFSLKELSQFRGRFGLGIERDRGFTPRLLKEVA